MERVHTSRDRSGPSAKLCATAKPRERLYERSLQAGSEPLDLTSVRRAITNLRSIRSTLPIESQAGVDETIARLERVLEGAHWMRASKG